MTKYLIAFRSDISTRVVTELLDYHVDYESIYPSEYGLTIVCNTDESVIDEYDWALSMICNLDQNKEV